MQTKTVWCNSINQRRCDMLKVGFLIAKIWQPWYNDNKNMDCCSRLSFLDNKWFCSVQLLSRVQLFVTPWTAARQASRSITNPRACSNSCPWSRWCHPAISSSVVPFSSCPQSLPASGSFLMSQLFPSSGQSTRASTWASVLSMKIQGGFSSG